MKANKRINEGKHATTPKTAKHLTHTKAPQAKQSTQTEQTHTKHANHAKNALKTLNKGISASNPPKDKAGKRTKGGNTPRKEGTSLKSPDHLHPVGTPKAGNKATSPAGFLPYFQKYV